ncbi:MAG TPA: PepSY-associated TM helix domain-containing protein [Puia sp.]
MRKRRTLKYWIGQLHLWLGLASGLVVLIVSLTGCLFVFQQEISEVLHREWFFVKPSTAAPLPLSILEEKAQAVLGPGRLINSITVYPQQDRSMEFMAYRENDSALTYFGSVVYYQSVFLNPYTGAVTGGRDYKYDFFYIVKYLHWSLLLNTPYGQPIVGWSTLIFVILLITGIVLWWPKKWTKAWRDRSFKIKWKATFKRVNYDLHNVPGFYGLLPALIIAYTGLVFAFSWLSPAPAPQIIKRSDTTQPATTSDPLDKAMQTAKYRVPGASRFSLSPAAGKEDVIYLYAYKGRDTYYGYDVLQFDQYSGVLLHHGRDKEKKAVQRLFEKNYDIHVGAIGGLTGKIIAFIASLICASLPVTGFLIWWGKRHKKKPSN